MKPINSKVKAAFAGLAFYASIVTASILHGSDKVGKGYLIAGVLLFGILFSFFLGTAWWALLVGTLSTLLYWFLYRTGTTAEAEMDFMYMANRTKLSTVWKSYILPVSISIAICLPAFYFAKQYYWMIAPVLAIPSIYVPAWASKKYADYKQIGFTTESERKARSRVELWNAIAPSGIYAVLVTVALSLVVSQLLG